MRKFIEPPDEGSYSLSEKSDYSSVELPGGPPRVRRNRLGSWQPINVTWTFFADDEYRYFQSFYQGFIASGKESFLLDVYVSEGELSEREVRFVPGAISISNEGKVFTISHDILVNLTSQDDDGGAYFDTH